MKKLITALLLTIASIALKAQQVILTPLQNLSKVTQDNEIVIAPDHSYIEFKDRTTGTVCTRFDIKTNSPYYRESLQKYKQKSDSWNAPAKDRRGSGNYYLNHLTRDKVMHLFNLQKTPAPVPPNFIFEQAFIAGAPIETKGDKVLVFYTISFYGKQNKYEHTGQLLLANRTTFMVLNSNGEIVWRINDLPAQATATLTSNGRYIGICYGNFAEDYVGDYYGTSGTWIYDLQTGEKILDQAFSSIGVGLAESADKWPNIFGLGLGAAHKDSSRLCYLDTEKRIIFTLTVHDRELSNTGYQIKLLDRGFTWKGRTYLLDKDFKQTPFSEPLKIK